MYETLLLNAAKSIGERAAAYFKDVFDRRSHLHKQVESIKFQLRTNRNVRSYFPLLGVLRRMFVNDPAMLEKGDNKVFFVTWLQHPVLELGWPIGGEFWNSTKIAQLYRDLDDLRV
jgi:hypothetical protein